MVFTSSSGNRSEAGNQKMGIEREDFLDAGLRITWIAYPQLRVFLFFDKRLYSSFAALR
jgi:hypothetical protein